MITFRRMQLADLPVVEAWLREPHVARWWTRDTTAAAQLSKYQQRIVAPSRTTMLIAVLDEREVGWCQWYRWQDHPAAARAMGAGPGEVGLDYAIGAPDARPWPWNAARRGVDAGGAPGGGGRRLLGRAGLGQPGLTPRP